MHILSQLFLASAVLAWNPSNDYTPSHVDCPNGGDITLVRNATKGLHKNETEWVASREKIAKPAMIDFLKRMNMSNFDADSFLSNSSINLGIAFSGGGYRAMLTGAGSFAALDNRTTGSTEPGHLGGLVQASTYLTGLSGGSWLVGSITTNNFSTIEALLDSGDVWDLTHSIFNPGGINIFSTAKYYDNIVNEIELKQAAGFNISITDIWGRALSQKFINLDDGGPAMTWNDIREYNPFTTHQMPFPIIVADGRAPNTRIISTNSTVFEINPYELGSWDPSLSVFTDVKWLGTNVTNGKPNNGTCVLGFDNSGFMMGTSSSLFNQFILRLNSSGVTGSLYQLASKILTGLEADYNDIAIYAPNPFFRNQTNVSSIEKSYFLALVDGGEDGQNVPLYPLIQPERKVDVIMAFDNTADTSLSWSTGSSISKTFNRQFGNQSRNHFFPSVPDNNTFVNNKLYERPVFFGCYASNFTDLRAQTNSPANYTPPLIIYNSNGYYTYHSNASTFQMKYESNEMRSIVENNYAVATYGNGTIDAEYGACVGCALIQRELERRGLNQTEQCKRCFDRYCWDGKVNDTKPSVDQIETMWASPNIKSSSASASSTKKHNSASSFDRPSTISMLLAVLLISLVSVGI